MTDLQIDKVEEIITMVLDTHNDTIKNHLLRVNSFLIEPEGYHDEGESDAIKTVRGVIGMGSIAGLLMTMGNREKPDQDGDHLRAFLAGYIYEIDKKLDDWSRQGLFVCSSKDGFRGMDAALCTKISEVLEKKFEGLSDDAVVAMSWRVGRKTAAFVRDGETIAQIFALSDIKEEQPDG